MVFEIRAKQAIADGVVGFVALRAGRLTVAASCRVLREELNPDWTKFRLAVGRLARLNQQTAVDDGVEIGSARRGGRLRAAGRA